MARATPANLAVRLARLQMLEVSIQTLFVVSPSVLYQVYLMMDEQDALALMSPTLGMHHTRQLRQQHGGPPFGSSGSVIGVFGS